MKRMRNEISILDNYFVNMTNKVPFMAAELFSEFFFQLQSA